MTTALAPTLRLIAPGSPDWDAVRGTFNLLDDLRPAAIAVPENAQGVAAAVAEAQRRGLAVVVQATGHNAAAFDSLDDALIVNTSRLTGVEIDAAALRVRVGAATTWEKVTPALSDLGLAGLHGSSPDVGIVGYSLGGGIGWLARKHGMQTNAVTAIEVVTADGELRRVDAGNEPDLFWALRGGNGNFGVVTALEFSALPVRELYAGAYFYPVGRTAEVLETWTALMPSLPEEMTTWISAIHFPPDPALPDFARGQSLVAVLAAHLGSAAEGQSLLAPFRRLGPEVDTIQWIAWSTSARLPWRKGSTGVPAPYPPPLDSAPGPAEGLGWGPRSFSGGESGRPSRGPVGNPRPRGGQPPGVCGQPPPVEPESAVVWCRSARCPPRTVNVAGERLPTPEEQPWGPRVPTPERTSRRAAIPSARYPQRRWSFARSLGRMEPAGIRSLRCRR